MQKPAPFPTLPANEQMADWPIERHVAPPTGGFSAPRTAKCVAQNLDFFRISRVVSNLAVMNS